MTLSFIWTYNFDKFSIKKDSLVYVKQFFTAPGFLLDEKIWRRIEKKHVWYEK